ncbi:hypothetical protein [Sphingomonas sp. 28-63-12]
MTDQKNSVHISDQDARAGTTRNGVRFVLGISLVLIVIIFAVLFIR